MQSRFYDLGLHLLRWSSWLVDWLAIWSILNATLAWSSICPSLLVCLLLRLLGIVILLEVLLGHLSLYDHKTGVDKGFSKDEKLRQDYDAAKFREVFNEEMNKLEKEQP